MSGDHKKKKSMKYEPRELYRTPWNQLSEEEQETIKEKAQLRREEEDRKKNRKIADIMLGRQRTQDNCWE
jgi:ribosomal protein S4